MRWLLVLILAFDNFSAPFHLHHHEGGGAPLEFVTADRAFADGDTPHADTPHVETHKRPPLSHSALAIRVDPLRLGQIPADADAVDDAQAAIASTAIRLLAAFDAPEAPSWRPTRSRPDFRSHRSLPPAGRAPPLHV